MRNFAIIAHVDHGKSTLADRLLEITGTIAKNKLTENEQYLDQNPISRERGITIKLAPVRMQYHQNGKDYIFNLIDTPGHVDFSYEVSRTLACCEGVVLLVDATQGIQAQTVAHYMAAKKQNLVMIPVINKIDLPNAQTEAVTKTLCESFGFSEEEIIYVSAKTGKNVTLILDRIIMKIPPPQVAETPFLRALVFDAVYDEHRGVIAFVRVMDGAIKKGERVALFQSKSHASVGEVGYFLPNLRESDTISAGEIGYIVTGIKDIHECHVGDTITTLPGIEAKIAPLPGYKQPKSMVFFGIYPKSTTDLVPLREALSKIALTDSALTIGDEYSTFLGSGFRVGFLGLLHAEIIKQRLTEEYGVEPLLTMPQVLYEKEGDIIKEPYMFLTVYAPPEYVGALMTVCQKNKGMLIDLQYKETFAVLTYDMPYTMMIRGIASELKSVSAGYASIDYEITDYRVADFVTLEIRVNDTPIDVLSEYVYREDAPYTAREKAKKLKSSLDRQQFRQVVHGVVNGTILAREEIPPFRKDVLQKMSGGDVTRKNKLLDKQKKGKSKMLTMSKVDISQEALLSMLKTS